MSYSLQTSFGSVMKDWADKYHVWGCIFGQLWKFFYFSAAGGARKLMKFKHIFACPEKTELKKIHTVFFIFLGMQRWY